MLVKKPLVFIAKFNPPPRVSPDSGEANPGGSPQGGGLEECLGEVRAQGPGEGL